MFSPPTHDPLDYIRTLQQTVTGSNNYASGFPILKELLQNAEDSQASHFDYGYYNEVKGSQHSLLQCPGVFTLSNGFFGIKNARKIAAAIGGSSKVSEENSIGKFGLGLKSVFNLCEAFFYISDQKNYQDDYGEYNGFNFFNPWSVQEKDRFHKNWTPRIEPDRDAIYNYFQFLLNKDEYKKLGKNWLLLLIPLRQSIHQPDLRVDIDGNPINCIREQYFDCEPSFLNSSDTQNRFSQILPMLTSVEYIRFWQPEKQKLISDITFTGHNGKRTQKLVETPIIPRSWSGYIEINQYQPVFETNLDFWGVEKLVDDKLDSQAELKDFGKLQPHIAIVISRHNSLPPKLIIQPAVFLPVGLPVEELDIELKQCYQITIHGCFKPNSTRTSIQGLFTDSGEPPQWNHKLYCHVLPLLLNALDDFSKVANVDEINSICQVVRNKTKLFEKDKSHILKDTSFLCVITQNFTLVEWQLIKNTEDIVGVPFFTNDLSDIFPGLVELSQGAKIIDKSKSNLILQKERLDWKSDQILLLVKSLRIDYIEAFIQNIKSFDFLKDILQQNKRSLTQEIRQSLVLVLQSIFSKTTTQQIQQKAAELIDFLDPNQWISLPGESKYIKWLCENSTSVLIVPKSFKDSPKSSLKAEHAAELIQKIVNQFESNVDDLKLIIKAILKSVVDDETILLNILLNKCKFIRTRKLGKYSEGSSYQSIYEIEKYKYKYQDNPESYSTGQKLIEALDDETLVFIDLEIWELSGNKKLEKCNRVECLRVLSSDQTHLSKDAKKRQKILEFLIHP
jgi:hypothetical protein